MNVFHFDVIVTYISTWQAASDLLKNKSMIFQYNEEHMGMSQRRTRLILVGCTGEENGLTNLLNLNTWVHYDAIETMCHCQMHLRVCSIE